MQVAFLLPFLSLLIWGLTVFALWKIFVKAGRPGWASLIPFYNMHVLYRICWEPKYFWFQFLLIGGAGVLQAVDDTGMLTAFAGALALAAAVMALMLPFRLAKAFGKGKLFGLGLLVLNTVFILILGLGDADYVKQDRP